MKLIILFKKLKKFTLINVAWRGYVCQVEKL